MKLVNAIKMTGWVPKRRAVDNKKNVSNCCEASPLYLYFLSSCFISIALSTDGLSQSVARVTVHNKFSFSFSESFPSSLEVSFYFAKSSFVL